MKLPIALLTVLACFTVSACVGVDTSGDEEPILSESSAQLSLEWLIVDGEELISCVDAGASEVEIAVLGHSERRQRTSCYGGFAVIDAVEEGTQLVEVSLVSPEGDRLVTAELGEVDVIAGATVPLGAVELSL